MSSTARKPRVAESDGAWGALAEHDAELAEAWDGLDRLPEPGDNDVLDAFVASRNINHGALIRAGTRLAGPTVLAFACGTGIKYRSMVANRRWTHAGSEFITMHIARAGAQHSDTVIVAEGETDGARLTMLYPQCDVAVLPGGAKRFTREMAAQVEPYEYVYIATDNDEAGDQGAAKIGEHVAHAVRLRPPTPKDWCQLGRAAEPPPLPDAPARQQGLRTRGVDLSRVRPPRFLWDGRVLVGSLNLLIGNEGLGKGTLVAWVVARVTRGELDGDFHGEPQNVLIVGDEDSFDEAWVPRLAAAGADLTRVQTLADGEQLDDLGARVDDVKLACEREGFGLIVLDQLLDHMDGGKDGSGIYNAKHVRSSLSPFRRLARDAELPMLGLLHPPKGRKQDFRDLVGASHQFNALSRSTLLLAQDPTDPVRRLLVRGKGNHSIEPQAVEFAIVGREVTLNGEIFGVPVVDDVQLTDRSTADLLGAGRVTAVPADEQMARRMVIARRAADGPLARKNLAAALEVEDLGPFKRGLAFAKKHGWLTDNSPYDFGPNAPQEEPPL
jgi:hypothetical protein